MSGEESNEDYFERNYFKETNHKGTDPYYTNLFLARITDRLTALNFLIDELNGNLRNINHKIYELTKREEQE